MKNKPDAASNGVRFLEGMAFVVRESDVFRWV